MLLIKIFGLLDLFSAVVMLLVQFTDVPWRFIIAAAAWLLLKGWFFRGDAASMIDLGIGCYHVLMVVLPIPVVTVVFAAYLLVKGGMSLL